MMNKALWVVIRLHAIMVSDTVIVVVVVGAAANVAAIVRRYATSTAYPSYWHIFLATCFALFLHVFFLLDVAMIRCVADDLGCLFDTQSFQIIRYGGEVLALRLFKVLVIFCLTLNSGILGQSPDLRRVSDSGGLRLGAVSITVGPLLKALVVFHI